MGGSYYDVKQGRYVTRGENVNGYQAQDNNPASYVDWLGVAQTTADTVGLIPVLNIPTSLVSGGISLSRGDYAGAGLSLIAVIPLAGEEADAIKIAKDADKLEKEVSTVGDAAKDINLETNIVAKRHGTLRKELEGTVEQSHHLNQNAAYRDAIHPEEGLATPLRGNILTDIGSPHYNAHASLESFWTQFRKGGARFGDRPTNLEYSKALLTSLQNAGKTRAEAMELTRLAARQRIQSGRLGGAKVPRIPGKINLPK